MTAPLPGRDLTGPAGPHGDFAPQGNGSGSNSPLGAFTDATRYEVSCLPLGHRGRRHFTITVEWRGVDSWAVMRDGYCWDAAHGWSYESMPSSRDEDWIARNRSTLDAALRSARELAPHISVMGHGVRSAIENPDRW